MPKSPDQFDFSKPEQQEEFERLPKSERNDLISENQKEANILKGKIELGEVKDYDEAVKEFEDEFIITARQEIEKRGIPGEFTLQKLRVDEEYTHGMPAMPWAYDRVIFDYPDYEHVKHQQEFIGEKGNLIIVINSSYNASYREISDSLDKNRPNHKDRMEWGAYFEAREIKDKHSLTEISSNPELKEKYLKGYDLLLGNEAIRVECPDGDSFHAVPKFIANEINNGVYIIDALKKAEDKGLIKIGNIPSFFTDEAKMKLREDEINAILEDLRNNIKSTIKRRMESKVLSKLEDKKKREETQKIIQKKYGDQLKSQKSSLSNSAWDKLNEALLRFNSDESHSAVYREYKDTKGLDIKDGVAVFLVEKSSLNLEGRGGEEIDVELVMVDDNKTRVIKKFHIRDRWDEKKDDFDKWYDGVKIYEINTKENLITLKLSKKRDTKKEKKEIIDLKDLDRKDGPR